jgi:hypothetical protein
VAGLPNILGRVREEVGKEWVFHFANGLEVHTDPFMRRDTARVLPIGGPQEVILNRLAHKPELVAGKHVLDAFCGSGILGLMALKLGAEHVDFVDINSRAALFTERNCQRNGFSPDRFSIFQTSIADYACERRHDVVLANPPFVMTPDGIEGTLTSRAGATGNDLIELLFSRLDDMLEPVGEAYLIMLQLLADGAPVIACALPALLPTRAVAFTPVQAEATPFALYVDAYHEAFPQHRAQIDAWQRHLRDRHGDHLTAQHYALRVRPRAADAPAWEIIDDLDEEYGETLRYPPSSHRDLALGRVVENLVLPRRSEG